MVLRIFDRELFLQNNASCSNGGIQDTKKGAASLRQLHPLIT